MFGVYEKKNKKYFYVFILMVVGALRCMTLWALDVVKKKLFSPSIW